MEGSNRENARNAAQASQAAAQVGTVTARIALRLMYEAHAVFKLALASGNFALSFQAPAEWAWYAHVGLAAVCAYLSALDLVRAVKIRL